MKRIMMVHNLDGTEQRTCPKCSKLLSTEDNGMSMSNDAGGLNEQDNGDSWVCWNKDCDAYGIGFSPEDNRAFELAFSV